MTFIIDKNEIQLIGSTNNHAMSMHTVYLVNRRINLVIFSDSKKIGKQETLINSTISFNADFNTSTW